ncbi:MAG: NAD(P)/FAD-dependent oxidoreductase [Caldilineaceae bacterium]
MPNSSSSLYDTLIIGAGAAGLAAGRTLVAAGQSILILEARDRIGGRIWTDENFAAFPIERGAELIHGEQTVTHDLLQAAGLQTLPAPRKPLLRWGTATGMALIADLPPHLRQTMKALNAAYAQLPQQYNRATDESLAAYFRRHGFDAAALDMADVLFAQTCCASIETLSCADLAREMTVDHAGLEEFRIREGYGTLLNHYSQGLPLRLNQPVQTIQWDEQGVRVRAGHEVFQARHCMITVPVGVLQAGMITFDPPLSAAKQAAIAAFRMEAGTKLFYRFRAPLWDETVAYVCHTGVMARWWTAGYPRPDAAVLCCYVTADRARQVDALAEADALQLGLDELAILLNRPDVHEQCIAAQRIVWAHDPYARGAYAHIPPGEAAARPQLAAPEGDVLFFAGEATAYETNPQTVHGAIESGWRAAQEVMASAVCTKSC